jgi:redox-sensitive bicupin YhaK (pirin superfamily)
MSINPLSSLETLIVPRARDLGGFEVRRALPAPQRQMVGPFIFFDQMGPAEFLTGQGIDVRPHPHIGLATVTYLYRGEFQHRDSLGSNQIIRPGAVNWMVAGRGVTHSERTSEETRRGPSPLFGVQTWVALPTAEAEGAQLRLILGSAYGMRAPASVYSDTFYVDAVLAPAACLPLPEDHEDRGVYVIEGDVEIAGETFAAGRMMVFRPGDKIALTAGPQGARLLLLGGATLEGPRYIWWNFVASSQEKIDAAKEAWRAQDRVRFDLPPDDRAEFIPAP